MGLGRDLSFYALETLYTVGYSAGFCSTEPVVFRVHEFKL